LHADRLAGVLPRRLFLGGGGFHFLLEVGAEHGDVGLVKKK
jgi:hypothetical protein